MARGDKSAYTDKQKRQAEHIEQSYRDRGVPAQEAEARAWATVNKASGGGRKSGAGRGRADNKAPYDKGGKKGGAASASRSAGERSASVRKGGAHSGAQQGRWHKSIATANGAGRILIRMSAPIELSGCLQGRYPSALSKSRARLGGSRSGRSSMFLSLCLGLLAAILGASVARAGVGVGDAGSSASLRETYSAVRERIDGSPFGKPVHLESVQFPDAIRGDIVARIDRPFETVRNALHKVRSWCDILILHPNIQQCRTVADGNGAANRSAVIVQVGRAGHEVRFGYQVTASSPDYLDVQLAAAAGPLGTTDYRIRLQATPLDAKLTAMHLGYSHGYGLRARLAMQAYLGTFGRDKVGFTVVDRAADGRPVYVDGFRGALERNAMRYYLAIDAYLESLSAPPNQQADQRIRTWYGYTERFPLQLGEAPGYLEIKTRQVRNSQLESPLNAAGTLRGGG